MQITEHVQTSYKITNCYIKYTFEKKNIKNFSYSCRQVLKNSVLCSCRIIDLPKLLRNTF